MFVKLNTNKNGLVDSLESNLIWCLYCLQMRVFLNLTTSADQLYIYSFIEVVCYVSYDP